MDPRPPNQTKPTERPAVARPPSGEPARQGGQFSSHREIAVVQADYLALANDLEQAQALANALELQLSGKANELAGFKAVWERTQANLSKLERDVDAMRKERHALANEVQRAYAFEHRYEALKKTHDGLTERLTVLESDLATEQAAHAATREKLAQEIRKGLGGGSGSIDPLIRESLEAIRQQIDLVLGAAATGNVPKTRTPPAADRAADRIDIQFDR